MKVAENKLPIFKKRFNKLRGKKTQAEFADFLGISRPTVGFYENGDRLPDALTLKTIAEKCGVSSDWLIGLADDGNKKWENIEVGRKTGLHDKAIETLEKYQASVYEYQMDNGIFGEQEDNGRYNALNALLESHVARSFLYNLREYLFLDFPQTLVGDKIKVPTGSGIIDAKGEIRHLPPEQLAAVYLVAMQQNLMELKKEVEQNGNDSKEGR